MSEAHQVPPTRQVTLTATLTDSGGNPLASQALDFQYQLQGATAWVDIGTLQTNNSGQATTTVALPAPNTYNFQVIFAGTTSYPSATAQDLGVAILANVVLKVTTVVA